MIGEDILFASSENIDCLHDIFGDDLSILDQYLNNKFFGVQIPLANIICSISNPILSDRINPCTNEFGRNVVNNMIRVAALRITTELKSAVQEVVSNAIDSYSEIPIGKFGVGWFSVLSFCMRSKDNKIIVETVQNHTMYKITLIHNGEFMVQFDKDKVDKEHGTKVIFDGEILDYLNIEDYIIETFYYSRIKVGSDKIIFNANEQQITVQDFGIGMNLWTIMNKLLIPTSSTKEVKKINYNKEDYSNIYINFTPYTHTFSFIVSNVIVETYYIKTDHEIEIAVELYPDTPLPITREQILMTPAVFQNISDIFIRLFDKLPRTSTYILQQISEMIANKHGTSFTELFEKLYSNVYSVPHQYYSFYKTLIPEIYTRDGLLGEKEEEFIKNNVQTYENVYVGKTVCIVDDLNEPTDAQSSTLYFMTQDQYDNYLEDNQDVVGLAYGLYSDETNHGKMLSEIINKAPSTYADMLGSFSSKIIRYSHYMMTIRHENQLYFSKKLYSKYKNYAPFYIIDMIVIWSESFINSRFACQMFIGLLTKIFDNIEDGISSEPSQPLFIYSDLRFPITKIKNKYTDNELRWIVETLKSIDWIEYNDYSVLYPYYLFSDNHVKGFKSKEWFILTIIINMMKHTDSSIVFSQTDYKTILSIIYNLYSLPMIDNMLRDILQNEISIYTVLIENIMQAISKPIFVKEENKDYTWKYTYTLNNMFVNVLFNNFSTFKEVCQLSENNKYTFPFQAVSVLVNEGTTRNSPAAVVIETIQNSIDVSEREGNVSIQIYETEEHVVYNIIDYVGITDIGLIAISTPFYSTKSEQHTGEMGTGFFTLYKLAKLVKIHTARNGRFVAIEDIPIVKNGRIVDIQRKVSFMKSSKSFTSIFVYFPKEKWIHSGLLETSHMYAVNSLNMKYKINNITIRPNIKPIKDVNFEHMKVYKNGNEISVVLVNGSPFMPLVNFLKFRNIHWSYISKISSGYIFDIRKDKIKPNTSRSKILFDKELLDEIKTIIYLSIITSRSMEVWVTNFTQHVSRYSYEFDIELKPVGMFYIFNVFIPKYVPVAFSDIVYSKMPFSMFAFPQLESLYNTVMDEISNEDERNERLYEGELEIQKYVYKYYMALYEILATIKTIKNIRLRPIEKVEVYESDTFELAYYNANDHSVHLNLTEIDFVFITKVPPEEEEEIMLYGSSEYSILIHELVHALTGTSHLDTAHGNIDYWNGKKYVSTPYNTVVRKIYVDIVKANSKLTEIMEKYD